MRGKLITLYGINNIGKSTHAKKLVRRLREAGYKAEYIKYPVYELEPTGPVLNKVLRGGKQKIGEDELQLWFVLNRYQFQPVLEKLLEEGVIVIAEDYVGTGMAWGVAKGLDEEFVENINSKLLKEDLAILFEGKRFLRAKEKGHVHEQNDDLVKKCAKVHREFGKKHGWQRLEVKEKKAATADELWRLVSEFLELKN